MAAIPSSIALPNVHGTVHPSKKENHYMSKIWQQMRGGPPLHFVKKYSIHILCALEIVVVKAKIMFDTFLVSKGWKSPSKSSADKAFIQETLQGVGLNDALEELTYGEKSIKIPKQFKADLSRGIYRLNETTLVDLEEGLESELAEKTLYEACRTYQKALNFNEIQSHQLMLLMNQTPFRDLMSKICETKLSNGEVINEKFSMKNSKPCYQIDIAWNKVVITLKTEFTLKTSETMTLEGRTFGPDETIGYIQGARKIEISRAELAIDWKKYPKTYVAPSLLVNDSIVWRSVKA